MHTGISGKNLREGAGALLVLLAVLILLAGLVRGLNYLVVDDADSYTRLAMHELYTGEEPVETLFLGSSHCFRAYDPALYEALTGESAFNLGSSSQNYDTSYYLLKEALARHPVKKVYLDMYYAFLFIGREDAGCKFNKIQDQQDAFLGWCGFFQSDHGAICYGNRQPASGIGAANGIAHH